MCMKYHFNGTFLYLTVTLSFGIPAVYADSAASVKPDATSIEAVYDPLRYVMFAGLAAFESEDNRAIIQCVKVGNTVVLRNVFIDALLQTVTPDQLKIGANIVSDPVFAKVDKFIGENSVKVIDAWKGKAVDPPVTHYIGYSTLQLKLSKEEIAKTIEFIQWYGSLESEVDKKALDLGDQRGPQLQKNTMECAEKFQNPAS